MLAALGLAVIAALPAAAPAAAQSQAWVTTNVNLRSGPGTMYPPVLVVPAGAPVAVFGCVEGYSWCDIAYGEARGFVAGSLLSYEYQSVRRPVIEIGPQVALPIIAFALGSYWDNHYRARPFYRERDRWERRYHAAPPPRAYYRPPPSYREPPRRVYEAPRAPMYRPDYRDDRRRFEQERRREYDRPRQVERRPDRRPDYRPDYRPEPPRRVERQQFRRDGSPRDLSGGQTERDAQRFNRQSRGAQPGE
ncbi:SH3 domain-containing protein [Stella sp.]|uniref:SH3 domain-containing protein n=1 Tax=Stella sp. TaxID=2912054 RepID=UPI0035B2F87F